MDKIAALELDGRGNETESSFELWVFTEFYSIVDTDGKKH